MKNCKMCGESFTGKRSDSVYCSNSCKAKYFELKNKGELPKNSLSGIHANTQIQNPPQENEYSDTKSKHTTEFKKVKSVDVDDLTPFDNLFEDWDDINATEKVVSIDSDRISENNFGNEDVSKSKVLPVKFIQKNIEKDNPIFLRNKSRVVEFNTNIQKCSVEIERLNTLLKKVENDTGNVFIIGGLAVGGALAGCLYTPPPNDIHTLPISTKSKRITQLKKENSTVGSQNLFTTLLSVIVGGTVGAILKSEYQDNNKISKAQAINLYQSKIKEVMGIKWDLLQNKNKVILENNFIKNKFIESVEVINPEYEKAFLKQGKINNPFDGFGSIPKNSKNTINSERLKTNPFEDFNTNHTKQQEKTIPNPLENEKVSSMKKIADLKFSLLNFKGKWLDFFGLPQTNFFCVIHGMSGEGKTNFSIQFAKYLAENFGNVLYISGEEGFAPTFQQKIKALGANTVARLYAADIRTGEEILTEIPNKYHFIVIDSVNNMNIDPDMMKEIRKKYKQSGIIAICQSTKDGKIRGSYQIVHDSDIAVKVVNGIAITTKNRFKEKHQEFDVFAVYNKSNPKAIKKVNTNDEDFDGLNFDNTIK
jgi:hypothetical protein